MVLTEEEFLFLIFDKIEFKSLFMKYWRQYSNLIEDLNIDVRRNFIFFTFNRHNVRRQKSF